MADCGIQNATPDNPLGTPNLDPLCGISAAVDSKVADLMNDWKNQIQEWFGDALAAMVKATSTAWLNITTPAVTLGDPANNTPSEVVGFLIGLTLWISGTMLVASVVWGLGKMAATNQPEHGIQAGWGVVRYVVAAGAGAGIVGILVAAADELSSWFIEQATGGDFAAGLAKMVIDSGGLAFILIILFAIFGLITTLIQIILLVWRGGALVVLTGALAWAASMSGTAQGKEMFNKYVGWLVAYILYKPVAALFYAAAFKLMTTPGVPGDTDRTIEHISGMALMLLALLALPAMIRLVAPLTAAVASGRGTGAALGAAAAVALPMGAMALAAGGGAASAAGAAAGGAGGGGGGGGAAGAAPLGGGDTGPTGSGGGGSTGPAPTGGDSGGAASPAPSATDAGGFSTSASGWAEPGPSASSEGVASATGDDGWDSHSGKWKHEYTGPPAGAWT